jgi:hypothetical protein
MLKNGFVRNLSHDGWDRRRIPVALDIEYWPMNGLRSRPGRINEIGMDGFLLCLREYLEIGQHLRISVLCDFGAEFLLVEPQVRVIWNERPLQGSCQWFHSGVNIIKISVREYQILAYFLLSLENKFGNIRPSKRSDQLPGER